MTRTPPTPDAAGRPSARVLAGRGITRLVVSGPGAEAAAAQVRSTFPGFHVARGDDPGAAGPPGPAIVVDLTRWESPAFDPRIVDEPSRPAPFDTFELIVNGSDRIDAGRTCAAVLEVVTRLQRWIDLRNEDSSNEEFARAEEAHRRAHDLRLPLVAADHAHALDTWRWVLRLAPRAGAAIQLAALFHDIERLSSEPAARTERLEADYSAFKRRHAEEGARIARSLLCSAGVPESVGEQTAELIRHHEEGGNGEAALLADADALSFFSLNASGFADYHGPDHTLRKVGWTLARMSDGAIEHLPAIRVRADLRQMIEQALAAPGLAGARPGRGSLA